MYYFIMVIKNIYRSTHYKAMVMINVWASNTDLCYHNQVLWPVPWLNILYFLCDRLNSRLVYTSLSQERKKCIGSHTMRTVMSLSNRDFSDHQATITYAILHWPNHEAWWYISMVLMGFPVGSGFQVHLQEEHLEPDRHVPLPNKNQVLSKWRLSKCL